MKQIFAVMLFLAAICLSFAGTCPAGASDCFLCGGTNGIPCARTDACLGHHDDKTGLDIACECPQGKPCACYCPYSDYGIVKDKLIQSDDKCAGCLYGCSKDGSVCISANAEDMGASKGSAEITAIDGEELLVSNDGGITWGRATAGMLIDYGYVLKTGPNSKMSIQFIGDNSKVFLDPDTTLNMKLLVPKSYSKMDVIIELIKGALFSDVTNREGSKFEVDTTVSVTGVKGTQFSVSYDPVAGKSITKAYEGNVSVRGSSGTTEISPGHSVTTTKSGNGAVTEFDPSEDKTPFTGGMCCGSGALIMMSAFIVGSRIRVKK